MFALSVYVSPSSCLSLCLALCVSVSASSCLCLCFARFRCLRLSVSVRIGLSVKLCLCLYFYVCLSLSRLSVSLPMSVCSPCLSVSLVRFLSLPSLHSFSLSLSKLITDFLLVIIYVHRMPTDNLVTAYVLMVARFISSLLPRVTVGLCQTRLSSKIKTAEANCKCTRSREIE